MKTGCPHFLSNVLLIALISATSTLTAQDAGVPLQPKAAASDAPASVAGTLPFQHEAMARYPELGRPGSPFNVEFLARVRNYRVVNRAFFQNERWPVLLAEQVAAAGFPTAVAVIEPSAPSPTAGTTPLRPGASRLSGRAVTAPADAPSVVASAVEAGNMLQHKPYKWGGGHGQLEDSGYDCSGSVSYVLRKAGLLREALTSRGFASYGNSGPGRWITIYASPGHAFMTVCGLRLDTGGHRGTGESGPRWSPVPRHASGFVARHPPGF